MKTKRRSKPDDLATNAGRAQSMPVATHAAIVTRKLRRTARENP